MPIENAEAMVQKKKQIISLRSYNVFIVVKVKIFILVLIIIGF